MAGRTFRRVRRIAVAAPLLALLAVVGCGRVADVRIPSEPAGITGEVMSLERADTRGVLASMLVEGPAQPSGAVSDKASVTVTEQTSIARAGRWVPAEELAVGQSVRVWFTGPVAESYPVQGTAEFVEIR